jgi:hypothetical protein
MTISTIARTNTIDEWRIQTNQSAGELNKLESGTYTKYAGSLLVTNSASVLITANGTSLQVSNTALFQSEVIVGRELDVGVESSQTGNVIVGRELSVLGPNTSFYVANNATVNSLRVNTSIEIGGTISTNVMVAGRGVVNTNIEVLNTVSANTLIANNVYSNSNVYVTDTVTAQNISTYLAHSDIASVNTLFTVFGNGIIEGDFVVRGTFAQVGNTEISTDTLTVNANTLSNKDASIVNYRTYGDSAVIKWSEVDDRWKISKGNTYTTLYNIMDESYITTSTSSTDDLLVPSANTLRIVYSTAGGYANNAYLHANSAFVSQNATGIYANSAFAQANLAIQQGGVITGGYANSAYIQANSAFTQANLAIQQGGVITGGYANSAFARANTADQRAVTSGSYANSAFAVANSAFTTAGNALPRSGGTVTGALTVQANIDASGYTITAATFSGTATQARYADLAEKYTTDFEYPVGTVVVVSPLPEYEATISTETDQVVLGVISEKPAYLMNKDIVGQAIALRGRVPLKVLGPVNKGQTLISAPGGYGIVGTGENKFAIALESVGTEEGVIEVVIL